MTKEYIFNDDGILEVQQIRKCDLAFFYNRTPQAFRKELEVLFIVSFHKKWYTNAEVRKIFDHFGYITKADVEGARGRIEEYLETEHQRYRQKILQKWEEDQKTRQRSTTTSFWTLSQGQNQNR